MKGPEPEHFLQIVGVFVDYGKTIPFARYCCQARRDGTWRCGKCGRGVLLLDDPECRVCHAKATFDRRVNWEAFHDARDHFATAEWMRTFGSVQP